jgi:hypothetical protein
MISLDQLASLFDAAAVRCHEELEIDLAKIGELTSTMAAEYIGNNMAGWPPLAASTVAEKAAKGYPVPAPLLRTGAMRDSIKAEVDPFALELVVGSTDKVAVYQEMGTSRGIPPRPFLGLAMSNSLEHAQEALGETAVKLITPGSR